MAIDTSKHTITIPIEDYNKLMAAEKMEGLVELTSTHPLYLSIRETLERTYSGRGINMGSDAMEQFTIYIKHNGNR